MLDPLIDRQDRQVSGTGQPPGRVQPLQIGQYAQIAIAGDKHAIDEIRPWQVERLAWNRLATMFEQRFCVVAEKVCCASHVVGSCTIKSKENPFSEEAQPNLPHSRVSILTTLGCLRG